MSKFWKMMNEKTKKKARDFIQRIKSGKIKKITVPNNGKCGD